MDAKLWCAVLAVYVTGPLVAKASTCGGLDTVREATQPQYPPIARAARFGGIVIVMTSFDPEGRVYATSVLSGPRLLQGAALAYVKGLRANEYTGPRECAIVIRYAVSNEGEKVTHIDPQHVLIRTSPPVILEQPMYTIQKSHGERLL